MINRYNIRWYIIGVLVIIIGVVVLTAPVKEESFNIKDRCGPILNLISHTIQDETVCKTRCKSQCDTKDLSYSRVEFSEAEVGCHTCDCFCKDSFI